MFLTRTSLRVFVILAVAFPAISARASGSEPDDRERDVRREQAAARAADRELAEDHQHTVKDEIRKLEKYISELRRIQVGLNAKVENAELSADLVTARDVRRELVEIDREFQHSQIELERLVLERRHDIERRELLHMSERFDYVANWRDVAFEPPGAVMMATQAIVELHLSRGDPESAAEGLEHLLTRVQDRGTRTALRFALKDIYVELGRPDRAIEHMTEVVLENAEGGDTH